MRLPALALLLGCIALGGCMTVPIGSLIELNRVDFEHTDPEQLRAGVTTSAPVKPLANTELSVTIQIGDVTKKKAFHLVEIAHGPEVDALTAAAAPGEAVYVYRLAPRDAEALTLFRHEMFALKAGGGSGTLTIAIDPAVCAKKELGTGPLRASTWLRTEETSGFVELTRDIDLRRVMGAARIPRCAANDRR